MTLSAVSVSGCHGGANQAAPSASVRAIYPSASLPKLIAHRGGTADFPENTLLAIYGALANGADAIWLTVQLSRDGVPVLYRPQDLASLTDAHGPVAALTAAELARVNAGWQFKRTDPSGEASYPYRAAPVPIPTLQQALRAVPAQIPLILDMKALPAKPQAKAVAQVLEAEHAWSRVFLYSTEAAYQQAFSRYPAARRFESRDATRQRIFAVALRNRCDAPPARGTSVGFEMRRQVEIVEHFTLGEGRSAIDAKTWTPMSVQCFRKNGDVQIVGFAVNDAKAYRTAACLGLDGVLVDSPSMMRAIKKVVSADLDCSKE